MIGSLFIFCYIFVLLVFYHFISFLGLIPLSFRPSFLSTTDRCFPCGRFPEKKAPWKEWKWMLPPEILTPQTGMEPQNKLGTLLWQPFKVPVAFRSGILFRNSSICCELVLPLRFIVIHSWVCLVVEGTFFGVVSKGNQKENHIFRATKKPHPVVTHLNKNNHLNSFWAIKLPLGKPF